MVQEPPVYPMIALWRWEFPDYGEEKTTFSVDRKSRFPELWAGKKWDSSSCHKAEV